jgi:hypothetical protein
MNIEIHVLLAHVIRHDLDRLFGQVVTDAFPN